MMKVCLCIFCLH